MSEEGNQVEITATAAANAATAVGEIIRAAGDSKEAKEAGAQIGKVVVTLAKAINNCLLPIAAVNYALDSARVYFTTKFSDDLADATQGIPAESLVEPKPSLAGPALQGLAFCHDEPPLKKLYLELLATAMDSRDAETAHPAFVEIIRQITSKEAIELQSVLRQPQIPIVNIREHLNDGGGMRLLWSHSLPYTNEDGVTIESPHLPAMVDNWIRLGLVEVRYDTWIQGQAAYEWAKIRPEFITLKAKHETQNVSVQHQKGIMRVTAFGLQFAIATGIIPK